METYAKIIRRKPNTIVNVGKHMFQVILYGAEIVFIDLDTNEITLSAKGYKTITTFRRIKFVLETIKSGLQLRSIRSQWFVHDLNSNEDHVFKDGMTLNLPINEV